MTSPGTSGRHLCKFQKRSKMTPPTASVGIYGERLKRRPRNIKIYTLVAIGGLLVYVGRRSALKHYARRLVRFVINERLCVLSIVW